MAKVKSSEWKLGPFLIARLLKFARNEFAKDWKLGGEGDDLEWKACVYDGECIGNACGGSEPLREEGSGSCGEEVGMETKQVKPSVNSTRLPLDDLGPGACSYIFRLKKGCALIHTAFSKTVLSDEGGWRKMSWTCQDSPRKMSHPKPPGSRP